MASTGSQLWSRAAEADSVIAGIDPTKFTTANPFRLFTIQAIIIIAFARILGYGLGKVRQPTVIAEVIGGIILGPTVMGRIPHFTQHIFPPQSLPFLNLASTLGLVLFLFLVGLEVDLRVMRRGIKKSGAISFIGLAVPFAAGAGLAKGIYDNFVDKSIVSFSHFALFVAVATSITAFPVLARILTETKLLYTEVGVTTLAAGVGNDVVGWVLLALTVALVNAASGLIALYAILCIVAWGLVLFLGIRPVFVWLARRTGSLENGPTQLMITLTLILVLVSSWITDIIGVHAIFGAFLVGLMVPHEGGLAVAFTEKIEDLVTVIFLPIYFTLSGLKTNLGDLDNGITWAYTILIIVVAFSSKFLGCAVTAKLCRFGNRESIAIGTLMACKGLVELIVLNIGLAAGILNTQTFSMFVLMAIVTTLATTPLTLWAYPEQHRKPAHGDVSGATSGRDLANGETGEKGTAGVGGPAGLTASKRIMVVLTSFDHLPGLMSLVQLIRPSSQPAESSRGGALRNRQQAASNMSSGEDSVDDKGEEASTGSAIEHAPTLATALHSPPAAPRGARDSGRPTEPIALDVLRLVELMDRTSAVMRVAENEETMRNDPITNVFRTFTRLNRLTAKATMSVVPHEQFSSTVASQAQTLGSDFVLLPWTMPSQGLSSSTGGDGVVATLSSPFDTFFGRSAQAASSDASTQGASSHVSPTRSSAQHTVLARKLIQTAECDVGLLVTSAAAADAALAAEGCRHLPSEGHIVLAFMGGPDDRVALQIVSHFCAVNSDLSVTVLHVKRTADAGGANGSTALPTIPPTLHHSQSHGNTSQDAAPGYTIHDTLYRDGSSGNAVESMLRDDLAIQRARTSPALAQAVGAGRLRFETIETNRPVTDVLLRIEALHPTLTVVGRGRRSPTMGSHRDELRVLLSLGLDVRAGANASGAGQDAAVAAEGAPARQPFYESTTRLINGETCKTLGEVAFALKSVVVVGSEGRRSAAGLNLPGVLVIASSNSVQGQRRGGDDGIDVSEQSA